MMRRAVSILPALLALSLTGSAPTFAKPHAAAKKGTEMITCPIMKSKVAKSKAIAVKTKSGKTVYVCCKSCVNAAKLLK